MAFLVKVEAESGEVVAEICSLDCYLLPDGTKARIHTAPAWCRTCNGFTAVETLPSPELLETRAREFFAIFIKRPLLPEFDTPKEHARSMREILDQALHEAGQWRIALQSRTSAARCLECSGTDHFVIPEDARDLVAHPGVPGRRIRVTGFFVVPAHRDRLYDTEGRRFPDGLGTSGGRE